MPLYHGDLDGNGGLPPGALALKDRVIAADAIIIATPEYNYSIAGPLKNAFDWVSRARPMPWRGKSVYLMSASPSPMGGIRGLWQTRIPFEGCGSLVFPDMFALSHAHEAFDENGKLRDANTFERLDKELSGFVRLAKAAASICGQKKIAAALEEETEIQSAAE
jgi:NAD(P)H-dependent FMN reductase